MNIGKIIIVAALAAVVLGLLLVQASWKQGLRGASFFAASPFVTLASRIGQFSKKFDEGLKKLDELESDNRKLSEENAKLATENTVLKNMEAENARLRELLGFKRASQYRLLAARLVSRDASNWWSNIMVNRGYIDDEGLRSDLPVVTARGVVGKTGVVSRDLTEVILISNQNCKVAAMIESAREQGIISGEGSLDTVRPRTRLNYISRNAQIAVGERVLSSGLGGVFPSGLLLGVISEVPPLSPQVNFGLYREVYVEPIVDLSQLDEMFIVLEAQFTPVAKPSNKP